MLNWKSTWCGANFTRTERILGATRRTYSKRMSGKRESQAHTPLVGCWLLGSQHLRKGRLYKIRIASVNAQSNLVHGESVWLESETRFVEDAFRCQVADYKKILDKFSLRREEDKVRIKPRSFRPSLLTFLLNFLPFSFSLLHRHLTQTV